MIFKLPHLPYGKMDLEPFLSNEAVEVHYEKHHKGYVNKLNSLIGNTKSYSKKDLKEIIMNEDSESEIYNNASQIWNHNLFWKTLCPNSYEEPSGLLNDKIFENFGSFRNFRDKWNSTANSFFGSGWIWLTLGGLNNDLEIKTTQNAMNPLNKNEIPIMNCDLWEHSYYIDYRNEKERYLDLFWTKINWKFIGNNFEDFSQKV